MSSLAFLDKALEAVKAAQILESQGCLNSAANRSYYAVQMVSSRDARDAVKTATAFVMAVEKETQP
jgi:hypothetical protein